MWATSETKILLISFFSGTSCTSLEERAHVLLRAARLHVVVGEVLRVQAVGVAQEAGEALGRGVVVVVAAVAHQRDAA